jgi:hypothetical protein
MVRLGAVRSTVKLSAVSGETLPAASVARAVTRRGRVVTLGLAGRSYAATVRGGAWSVTVPVADVAALPSGRWSGSGRCGRP